MRKQSSLNYINFCEVTAGIKDAHVTLTPKDENFNKLIIMSKLWCGVYISACENIHTNTSGEQ